jgi:hypothetical protein
MGAPAIEMADELFNNDPQMAFVDRDQEIQTLPPNRPDQPLTDGVGDRRLLPLNVTLRDDVSG